MIYDVAILGGGPGGYTAAFAARKQGLSVILFEKKDMGGTCLNRGCVPTKFLEHAAKIYRDIISFNDNFGGGEPCFDYGKCHGKMEDTVSELRADLTDRLLDSGIEIIYGEAYVESAGSFAEREPGVCHAQFESDRVSRDLYEHHATETESKAAYSQSDDKKETVSLSAESNIIITCGDDTYRAGNVIIATGSECNEPINSKAITTDDLLKEDTLPKSVSIIGGGVTAVEFADILSSLGVKVSIYIRGEKLLRTWDKDIVTAITRRFKERNITVTAKCDRVKLESVSDEVVLSAAGRKCNISCISKELVEIGPKGGIVTDRFFQTKTNNIYAIGDVTEDSAMLAHVAMSEAKTCVNHIVSKTCVNHSEVETYVNHSEAKTCINYISGMDDNSQRSVTRCIYTSPEVASVGLTEVRAVERGLDYISIRHVMNSNARVVIEGTGRQFIKLLLDREKKTILGAHIVCDRAVDMISEFAMAIDNNMTVEDMLKTTRPHPGYTESINELLEEAVSKLK